MRYVDDRPANEDGSVTARRVLPAGPDRQLRWRNVEAAVTIFNLTNTEWNEAQFADTVVHAPGLAGPQPGRRVLRQTGAQRRRPADQLPSRREARIGVRAGITVFSDPRTARAGERCSGAVASGPGDGPTPRSARPRVGQQVVQQRGLARAEVAADDGEGLEGLPAIDLFVRR